MSLFSSILGGQGATPIGSPQAITTTEIPKQLAPYYTDILGKAQALYNKRTDEGYKPYEGPTIAQYTPEQEATFTGIAGLQGQVAPKFAEAEQMTRDAAGAITGTQIQEAMSPYQQAVTDIEKRESQKSFEQNVLPKLRAAQVAQGSFGGTRGTLLEAQALGDQQRMLGDIQTKGSQAAFKDARAALDAQRLRQGQGATQLANLAPAALSNQLKELGAQQTVGETKQRQAQTALDEAYRQFQLEKQEPYDAMSKYQSIVTGAPLGSTQYAPPAPPGPSLGQTLIGGAGTAAGLYGAFTGQNPLAAVGLMGKKEGGGIADVLPDNYPVIQAQDGTGKRTLGQRASDFFKRNIFSGEEAADEYKKILGDTSPIMRTMGIIPASLSDSISPEQRFEDLEKSKDKMKPFLRNPQGGKFIPNLESNITRDVQGIKKGLKPKPRDYDENQKIKKDKSEQGPEQGSEQGPKQGPKQGPLALTPYQKREMDITKKEKGILSLLKNREATAKTEKTQSKDAEYRAQMANMAKAFAQFATKGGQGNILQKAIGTAGDNVDAFVGTSGKFRKERKDIDKALKEGKMDVAQFEYEQVKDKAKRELDEDQRKLTAEALKYSKDSAIAAAKEDKRRFGITTSQKEREINQKIKKDARVEPSEAVTIRAEIARHHGIPVNPETGDILISGEEAVDTKHINTMNTQLKQITDLIEKGGLSYTQSKDIVNHANDYNLDISDSYAILMIPKKEIEKLKKNKDKKSFGEAFNISNNGIDFLLKTN